MPTENRITQQYWFVIIAMALIAAFAFQGTRGIYETSEGRYAEIAREMIETGNYLEPTLGYQPHWTKPPMTYWAISAGIKLLGPNEWGVRVYNSIAFFLTILAVVSIGTNLWDRRTGFVAGLIYLSSPFPIFSANAITTDTLLTLWEVSAVMCYIKAHRNNVTPSQNSWLIAMWFFFGLGFLTKGPPALLPLIPICIWHYRQKNKIRLFNPVGLLLFFLVGFSWYVLVCSRHHGLLSYFLGTEVIDRMTSDSVHNHSWYMPFVLYLPALTIGSGFWLYPGLKTLSRKKLYKPPILFNYLIRSDANAFLLLWILIPLGVFFIVKSRLPLYVLPVYAPVALCIARSICRNNTEIKWSARQIIAAAMASVFLFAGTKGIIPYYPYPKDVKRLYEKYCAIKEENSIPVIVAKRKLFGFQYYLNGRLSRLHNIGEKTWVDGDQNNLESNNTQKSYIFLTDKRKASRISDELINAGLVFQRFDSGDYVLYSVKTGKTLLINNDILSSEI